MKLTVVGCAGSFPSPSSPCSCYLVEAEGFRLLLDFGTGAVGELQRHGVLHDIDAVVLSHLHMDHCSDAATYLVVRLHDPRGPFPKIPLYGPEGTAERLAKMSNGAIDGDGTLDVESVFEVSPLVAERQIGPFAIRTARMNHPVETFGIRVEHGGRSLTYSGDSAESEALIDLAADTDLFLCEAAYEADAPHPSNVHLTGVEAGEHATRARARRLLLTHLVPEWVDVDRVVAQVASRYSGPTELATVGKTYEV